MDHGEQDTCLLPVYMHIYPVIELQSTVLTAMVYSKFTGNAGFETTGNVTHNFAQRHTVCA